MTNKIVILQQQNHSEITVTPTWALIKPNQPMQKEAATICYKFNIDNLKYQISMNSNIHL